MFDHVSIKVNDLNISKAFYEKAFKPLAYTLAFGEEGVFHAFNIGSNCLFEIIQHKEDIPITSCHVAFRVSSHEMVQAFHQAALDAGAEDFGAPGPRPKYTDNYYACFVLDPDGHNIEAMFNSY